DNRSCRSSRAPESVLMCWQWYRKEAPGAQPTLRPSCVDIPIPRRRRGRSGRGLGWPDDRGPLPDEPRVRRGPARWFHRPHPPGPARRPGQGPGLPARPVARDQATAVLDGRGEHRELVEKIVDVAYRAHLPLLVLRGGDEGTMIGGAQYSRIDEGRAEIGISVADEWQGKGIGPVPPRPARPA